MAFGLNSQVHRAIPQWIGLIESYTVITLDVEAQIRSLIKTIVQKYLILQHKAKIANKINLTSNYCFSIYEIMQQYLVMYHKQSLVSPVVIICSKSELLENEPFPLRVSLIFSECHCQLNLELAGFVIIKVVCVDTCKSIRSFNFMK